MKSCLHQIYLSDIANEEEEKRLGVYKTFDNIYTLRRRPNYSLSLYIALKFSSQEIHKINENVDAEKEQM